jgi:MoaA/NifB/PqqE/SkfB family radical SAM enzyme
MDLKKAQICSEHLTRYVKKQAGALKNGGVHGLEDVFLYVTSRCNATCEHCFYWQELNREEDEIQLAQFEKMAATMPDIENLIMTGGEPFLRRDIVEIVGRFLKHRNVGAMQFNTNGFTPKMIEKRIIEMCETHPEQRFHVMFSIDGFKDTHNITRNNPRAWELTNESITRCLPLQRGKYEGRLFISVLTVLHNGNYKEIEPLSDFIRNEYGIIHAYELVRGTDFSVWGLDDDVKEDYNPPGMTLPPEEEWDDIWARLNEINRKSGYLNRFYHLMTKWQFQMLREQGRRKRVKCISAGRTTATIYSNGDVAACEFSKPFANLENFEYDFDALWNSQAANDRRAQLGGCHCTHACYLTKNLEYSLKGQVSLMRNL